MELESINPIIRKITIGDLKQGLTYKWKHDGNCYYSRRGRLV